MAGPRVFDSGLRPEPTTALGKGHRQKRKIASDAGIKWHSMVDVDDDDKDLEPWFVSVSHSTETVQNNLYNALQTSV